MSYEQSGEEKKISEGNEFDFDDSGFADAYEKDTSSISLPQLPQAEDPIGILPGITQFLSQQFKTLLQPPEPKEAPEIIEDAGFRSEVHKVNTEDGYILTMHRVGAGVGPVVFLQHGLICSSVDWVLGARDKALGFILADAGYDVWMGNFRGNAYSREHTVLDPAREKFWHFSFDQMGQHDLPTMLNYVLELTRQEKLTYIGHSMGTMAFWVMMNHWPWMNAKVRLMVGLAPVTAPNLHRNSPLHPLATHSQRLCGLLSYTGNYEFLAKGSVITDLKQSIWGKVSNLVKGGQETHATQNILFDMAGVPRATPELLEEIVAHEPSGTSSRNIHHFGQGVNTQVFRAYDFPTPEENVAVYGREEPPEYKLEEVTCPVLLFWGQKDWMAQPRGVAAIAARLPGLIDSVKVAHEKWNHLDFMWGQEAPTLLFPQILEAMKQNRE